MKIINFTFEDKSDSWKLEKVSFDNLTLLVGASGVGKTRILKSLMSLKSIIEGNTLNGVSWEIEFSTVDDVIYLWKGEFENKGWKNNFTLNFDEAETDVKNKPNLIYEELYLNGNEITKREKQKNYFKGNLIPNTSPTESNLKIFRVEEDIKPAYEALQKLIYSDYTTSQNSPLKGQLLFGVDKLLKKYKSLDEIRNSDEKILTKLYMVYKNEPKTFDKIKDTYTDIFPYVADIKIEPLLLEDEEIPSILRKVPFIQIKEKGIDKWISQMELSAGMFRSLIHICELFLHSNGTVVLIDEFENSLGKNCIDEVTDIIISLGKKQQFIITSHHPSIINKIDYKYWKLVTRKQGSVSIHNLEKMRLDKSQHQAYLHLINLDAFIEGVM